MCIRDSINAVGLTTQNFLQMSLFTDPLGDGAFTRNWTVFYWLWWISYTPGVAMFVTLVSRGRKIKMCIRDSRMDWWKRSASTITPSRWAYSGILNGTVANTPCRVCCLRCV